MTRRERKRGPRRPEDVPLDDGRRDGTEPWREIGGVQFCHWDRWLLRLAITEQGGLTAIAAEFRRRARDERHDRDTAEAMLAHVTDLQVRLARLGVESHDVLDARERESKWLGDKAFRRVWRASSSIRKSAAMLRTPRRVLEERALSGNWAVFGVSPAPFAAALRAAIGDGYYDYRTTEAAVTLLDLTARRALIKATSDEERMAVHRAMLTVVIGAMEQVDDSDAEMAIHFREHEHAYLDLLRPYADRPGLLCDLLELAVWEDYGLFSRMEQFLSTLPEMRAEIAVRELARMSAELRDADLDCQLRGALRLRRAVLAVADAGDRQPE